MPRVPNAAAGDFMTTAAYVTKAVGLAVGGSPALGAGVAMVATAGVAALSYWLICHRLEGCSLVAPLVASLGLMSFSGGHRQRIRIARALCDSPFIAVLDQSRQPT